MTHLSEDDIIRYADDPDCIENVLCLEEHLRSCVDCWEAVRDYRLLGASLRAIETWEMAEESSGSDAEVDVAAFEARRIREDAAAEELLAPYLRSHYQFGYGDIATKKRFRSGGVVRRLCSAAHEVVVDDAKFALVLAETAASIAESLPRGSYPESAIALWLGEAWKEHSTACRFLGRSSPGLDSLDRAERAYERSGTSLNLGIVDAARAMLLFDLERYVEALSFVARAKSTFAAHADTKRHVQAQQIEANILQRKGDTALARAAFHRVYDASENIDDDLELRAAAALNLGVSYTEADAGEASRYLLTALQIYAQLGLRSELARVRWALALVTLAVGNYREAAKKLDEVVQQFEAGSMLGDANKARLDRAEALLMLSEWDEVAKLCSAVFAFFREADMLSGALTAAAFLQEAAARRTLTRTQIRYVREYLIAVERKPDVLFDEPHEE